MDRLPHRFRVGVCCYATVLVCILAAQIAQAGKVVLRIRAGNPIEEPQRVRIKSNLPARVSTNDIIDLGGLDLGYDVKSDTYYVHSEVELGPKEIKIIDVELNDIWVISEDELTRLSGRAREMVGMLEETDYHASAMALQSGISRTVDGILAHQSENLISAGVKPVQHIRAYETNLRLLGQVQKDVGRAENLVLASGQDPGELIGIARDAAPPRPVRMNPQDYKTAVLRITVKNTSPTESRRADINRDLPVEIDPDDVLDGGGLEVARDSKRNVTYVFKKDIRISPNETLTFDVKIRDKWDVNDARVVSLRARIDDMSGKIGDEDQFKSVDEKLTKLKSVLVRIGSEVGPETLNAEYVSFYRAQGDRLDEVEQDIHRIEAALRPVKQVHRGFPVQPPDLKTTWLIIYIIMGFLALISLLFFLRWMGRSKAEKLDQ